MTPRSAASEDARRPRGPRGKCPEMVEFLQDYVDGTLPVADRAAFERHISDCPGCVAFLHTYRETVRIGRGLDLAEDQIPKDLRARILSVVRKRSPRGT